MKRGKLGLLLIQMVIMSALLGSLASGEGVAQDSCAAKLSLKQQVARWLVSFGGDVQFNSWACTRKASGVQELSSVSR